LSVISDAHNPTFEELHDMLVGHESYLKRIEVSSSILRPAMFPPNHILRTATPTQVILEIHAQILAAMIIKGGLVISPTLFASYVISWAILPKL
jgi:hypothetical protein